MSFDVPVTGSQRIAVIGGGISGMGAAYLLSPQHRVTLFESEPVLGGHARTVVAGARGDQPVDTGFIVFNYANYPHLTRMFKDLEVPVERSDMTFGATIAGGSVEYGLRDLNSLFGQRSNLMRPGFVRMVRDILRFNDQAESAAIDETTTIGDLCDQLGLGDWFQKFYLMPISGAIWSTPSRNIRDFPARALVRFFRNHALLSSSGQHQWWTVSGGSRQYVDRLEGQLRIHGCDIRIGSPVQSVARAPGSVSVKTFGAPAEAFDQVIFACHSDQALSLLDRPTEVEAQALSAMRYQTNEMILHRDPRQMPKRRACWSSWVYKADGAGSETSAGVTYWMNRLQNIPESDPMFVSLNPTTPVREDMVYDQKTFMHPVFDGPATRGQKAIADAQGQNNTWYAGAYLRHGFHEDGLASAHRVARHLERIPV